MNNVKSSSDEEDDNSASSASVGVVSSGGGSRDNGVLEQPRQAQRQPRQGPKCRRRFLHNKPSNDTAIGRITGSTNKNKENDVDSSSSKSSRKSISSQEAEWEDNDDIDDCNVNAKPKAAVTSVYNVKDFIRSDDSSISIHESESSDGEQESDDESHSNSSYYNKSLDGSSTSNADIADTSGTGATSTTSILQALSLNDTKTSGTTTTGGSGKIVKEDCAPKDCIESNDDDSEASDNETDIEDGIFQALSLNDSTTKIMNQKQKPFPKGSNIVSGRRGTSTSTGGMVKDNKPQELIELLDDYCSEQSDDDETIVEDDHDDDNLDIQKQSSKSSGSTSCISIGSGGSSSSATGRRDGLVKDYGKPNEIIELDDDETDIEDDDDYHYSHDEKNTTTTKTTKAAAATATRMPSISKVKAKKPPPPPPPLHFTLNDIESFSTLSKAAFRSHRDSIAMALLEHYVQAVFGEDHGGDALVSVQWSNTLRTTAGQTRLKREYRPPKSGSGTLSYCQPTASSDKPSHNTTAANIPVMQRTAVIELSTKVIDDYSRLQATLLHEVCHAAAWIVDGVCKPPHGDCFQKWATRAMENIPGAPAVTTTHSYDISYKYAWACTNAQCNVLVQRQSRSLDVTKVVCGKCKSRLQAINPPNKTSQSTASSHKPKAAVTAPSDPSAYNLFIKAHSKSVRERLERESQASGGNSKVAQSDVMKECARLWQRQKENDANIKK